MASAQTVLETSISELPLFHRGKVRDVYEIDDEHLLLVATDRLSAFDVVLPTPIEHKGKVLTQLSAFWFDKLKNIVPNHYVTADFEEMPEVVRRHEVLRGRSMLVRKAEVFPVECVVRGYLEGSGWKDYAATGELCGIRLPAGLRESDRLNETIRSFLSYARPQPLLARAVDLMRLLDDTATLLRNSPEVLPSHRITVDGPDGDLILEADEGQVKQVIWNLATNGLRAMPDGGELVLRARLQLSAEGEDDAALEVVDHGVGIRPEQLDFLFQPFNGSFARGTGLGLAIVHRIVSDHGGEVDVQSQVGQGTTVLVTLPARRRWSQTA